MRVESERSAFQEVHGAPGCVPPACTRSSCEMHRVFHLLLRPLECPLSTQNPAQDASRTPRCRHSDKVRPPHHPQRHSSSHESFVALEQQKTSLIARVCNSHLVPCDFVGPHSSRQGRGASRTALPCSRSDARTSRGALIPLTLIDGRFSRCLSRISLALSTLTLTISQPKPRHDIPRSPDPLS